MVVLGERAQIDVFTSNNRTLSNVFLGRDNYAIGEKIISRGVKSTLQKSC